METEAVPTMTAKEVTDAERDSAELADLLTMPVPALQPDYENEV